MGTMVNRSSSLSYADRRERGEARGGEGGNISIWWETEVLLTKKREPKISLLPFAWEYMGSIVTVRLAYSVVGVRKGSSKDRSIQ